MDYTSHPLARKSPSYRTPARLIMNLCWFCYYICCMQRLLNSIGLSFSRHKAW